MYVCHNSVKYIVLFNWTGVRRPCWRLWLQLSARWAPPPSQTFLHAVNCLLRVYSYIYKNLLPQTLFLTCSLRAVKWQPAVNLYRCCIFYFHVSLPPGPHSVSVPVPGRPLPHPQDLTWVCMFFRSTLTNLALLFPAVIGHSVMIVFFLNSKGYYRLFETNPLFLIGIYIHHSLSPSFPLQKLYSLSIESGRSAAKYFIDNNPKFFAKDFAEPHIPVRHTAMKIPSQCTLVVKKKKSIWTPCAIWCTVLVSLKSPSAVYFSQVINSDPQAAPALFHQARYWMFQQDGFFSLRNTSRVQEL